MQNPLQINDLFWTVQGEGRWSGHRALFIRMPFCNYDCPWCDTDYQSYKSISEDEFITFCEQEPSRFAVITGGEPTLHKDTPRVIELLKKKSFYIACETNGSAPIPDGIDFPTVSPKKFTKNKLPEYFVHEEVFPKAKEWKYVVDTDFNFELLEKHSKPINSTSGHLNLSPLDVFREPTTVTFSLSPEYSNLSANTKKILEYIAVNPQWKLSLQTHKWINIP